MTYKIKNVKMYEYPNSGAVSSVLGKYNVNLEEIEGELKNHSFIHYNLDKGFQMDLSKQLEELFANLFKGRDSNVYLEGDEIKYSDRIDLKADVVIKNLAANKEGIYIELEFRPNECKDILKFEIGYKNNKVGLGILVVALNRNHINPRYITMPEYKKCKLIIDELKPNCPILLIGIGGEKSQTLLPITEQNRNSEDSHIKAQSVSNIEYTISEVKKKDNMITLRPQKGKEHLDKNKIESENIDKLITSSPTTLQWLNNIRSKINEKIPSLIYGESKYWSSFKSPETNRNVVYLQPQKSQIRLFTRLDFTFDKSLQPTPASSGWAEMYPSIFKIRSEDSIDKAVEIIISSYHKDIHK